MKTQHRKPPYGIKVRNDVEGAVFALDEKTWHSVDMTKLELFLRTLSSVWCWVGIGH